MDCPDTPEGVALVLWLVRLAILAQDLRPPDGKPRDVWLLDLYAECRRAVEGTPKPEAK